MSERGSEKIVPVPASPDYQEKMQYTPDFFKEQEPATEYPPEWSAVMAIPVRSPGTGLHRPDGQFVSCPDGTEIKDMADEEYFSHFPATLKKRIREINDEIIPVYSKANKASMEAQKNHKWISSISLIFALLAAGLAVVQIAKLYYGEWLLFLEAGTILISIGFWIFEKCRGYHKTWLIERHKAERCRFLKYRQIIDPLTREDFHRNCRDIQEIGESGDVQRWIEKSGIAFDNYSLSPPATGPEFFDLVRYYYCVRLRYQFNYYKKRISEKEGWIRVSKFVEPLLFILIAIFTLVHIILDLGPYSFSLGQVTSEGFPVTIGFLIVILVALLFVIEAGCKTLKVLFAYPQIYVMYRSAQNALMMCEANLSAFLGSSPKGAPEMKGDAESILQDIHHTLMNIYNCEEIMQHEHAVWFGIMDQAELV